MTSAYKKKLEEMKKMDEEDKHMEMLEGKVEYVSYGECFRKIVFVLQFYEHKFDFFCQVPLYIFQIYCIQILKQSMPD